MENPIRCESLGKADSYVDGERGQMLQLLETAASRNIYVIGTTNYPDSLDKALTRPGRFDTKITIPVPSKETCGELLKSFLSLGKASFDPELPFEKLGECFATAQASIADIKLIAETARRKAFCLEIEKRRKQAASSAESPADTTQDNKLQIVNKEILIPIMLDHFMKKGIKIEESSTC